MHVQPKYVPVWRSNIGKINKRPLLSTAFARPQAGQRPTLPAGGRLCDLASCRKHCVLAIIALSFGVTTRPHRGRADCPKALISQSGMRNTWRTQRGVKSKISPRLVMRDVSGISHDALDRSDRIRLNITRSKSAKSDWPPDPRPRGALGMRWLHSCRCCLPWPWLDQYHQALP